MRKKGMKYDDDKLRFDLIPPIALRSLAEVYTFGARKYTDNSWQNLPNFEERYLAALHRHLNAHQLGELRDEDSGLYHLDHLLWNVVALRWKLQQDEQKEGRVTIELGTVEFDDEGIRQFFMGEGHAEMVFSISPEGIPRESIVVHDDVDTET